MGQSGDCRDCHETEAGHNPQQNLKMKRPCTNLNSKRQATQALAGQLSLCQHPRKELGGSARNSWAIHEYAGMRITQVDYIPKY